MHSCQNDGGLCAWHKSTPDRYRRAYHAIITHAYAEAELEVIFTHTNQTMLEGKPDASALDDQTTEVLDSAAVSGLRFKDAASAYVHMLYDGGLL